MKRRGKMSKKAGSKKKEKDEGGIHYNGNIRTCK